MPGQLLAAIPQPPPVSGLLAADPRSAAARRLAVNLFGDRDSWAGIPDWNFHAEADARKLFDGLQILAFEVYDADGQSFRGPKHWHIFDVIARRP